MTEASRSFGKPEHLAETDWLERSLDDPDLRVFDCAVYTVGTQTPFWARRFLLYSIAVARPSTKDTYPAQASSTF